jgi:hypothetical protein
VKKLAKVWMDGLGTNLKYRVSTMKSPDFGDILKIVRCFLGVTVNTHDNLVF